MWVIAQLSGHAVSQWRSFSEQYNVPHVDMRTPISRGKALHNDVCI
jgi:hypothetical protein